MLPTRRVHPPSGARGRATPQAATPVGASQPGVVDLDLRAVGILLAGYFRLGKREQEAIGLPPEVAADLLQRFAGAHTDEIRAWAQGPPPMPNHTDTPSTVAEALDGASRRARRAAVRQRVDLALKSAILVALVVAVLLDTLGRNQVAAGGAALDGLRLQLDAREAEFVTLRQEVVDLRTAIDSEAETTRAMLDAQSRALIELRKHHRDE